MAVETPLKGNIGDSIKRKEDDRFIRGKGNYLDDVVLPGMLHMAIHRSPFAHARIKSINTDAAQAVPGVVAVVTGAVLASHKRASVSTLSVQTHAVSQSVVTPKKALEPGAPLIRDEKEGQKDNHIYHWEAGDKAKTEEAFAKADRVVKLDTFYPRCHPSPLETW